MSDEQVTCRALRAALALAATAVIVAGALVVVPEVSVVLGRTGADLLAGALVLLVGFSGAWALLRGVRAAQERLRSVSEVVESLDTVVWSVDMDGRWTYLSAAWEALTGVPVERALGSRSDLMVHPDDLAALVERFSEAMRGEAPGVEHEHRLRRADGTERWVHLTGRAVLDADGRPDGASGTLVDVTERRAADRMIRRAARWARGLPVTEDAREAICRGALDIVGVDFCVLMERHGDIVEPSAQVGVEFTGLQLDVNGSQPSGTLMTLRSQVPTFIADAPVSPLLVSSRVRESGLASTLLQPVLRDGHAVAVLVLGWRTRRSEADAAVRQAADFFAEEVAIAIERSDHVSHLRAMASTDALTGLPNRRALDDALGRALRVADGRGRPLTVVLLDLDHFKAYNDEHGHPAGDRLLHAMGRAWLGLVRGSDLLARYGGEEFALVLEACDTDTAGRVVDGLARTMPGGVTFSAGIAPARPGDDVEAVLERADGALYAAKAAGRGRRLTAGEVHAVSLPALGLQARAEV